MLVMFMPSVSLSKCCCLPFWLRVCVCVCVSAPVPKGSARSLSNPTAGVLEKISEGVSTDEA